jgi:hypothetical protein
VVEPFRAASDCDFRCVNGEDTHQFIMIAWGKSKKIGDSSLDLEKKRVL